MEFKSCDRCGSFFVAKQDLCAKCATKEDIDINKLHAYIETEDIPSSIQDISFQTGITMDNLARVLKQEPFKEALGNSSLSELYNQNLL